MKNGAHSSTRSFFFCVLASFILFFFSFLLNSFYIPPPRLHRLSSTLEEGFMFLFYRSSDCLPSSDYDTHSAESARSSSRIGQLGKRMNDKSLQSRVEVIYQSQGPSLRAVKHESSGGGVGGGGRRRQKRNKKLKPGNIRTRNIYERSWGTPISTTCMSTVCASCAEDPCHDVKTLMD